MTRKESQFHLLRPRMRHEHLMCQSHESLSGLVTPMRSIERYGLSVTNSHDHAHTRKP